MILKKSELEKIISIYLSEGVIGPSWLPTQSQENGDLFRNWVNDNKTKEEVKEALSGLSDPTLSRSGSYRNTHIRKAWRAFGGEFTAAMNAEELSGDKDRFKLRDLVPSGLRRRDEEEDSPEEEDDSTRVVKTPCIIFTGEFSPASKPGASGLTNFYSWCRRKIAGSDMPSAKKEKLRETLQIILERAPEGHGGTIVIKPPAGDSNVSKAYSCEFGRYKGKAPAEMENEMNDAFWKELNRQDEMNSTKRWRKKAGLAVPGKVVITPLGKCKLIKKDNGNYTIAPEEAEKLVEKALIKGLYPGTTRNPIIVDGCVYDRAMEYAGPSGDWRPYLLIPGLLPKIITNIIGLDVYKYENCGTYALKVALTGVYGRGARALSNVMLLLAAPETMIRIARVLFPQTWSPKKAVDKRDVLDFNEKSQPIRYMINRNQD